MNSSLLSEAAHRVVHCFLECFLYALLILNNLNGILGYECDLFMFLTFLNIYFQNVIIGGV